MSLVIVMAHCFSITEEVITRIKFDQCADHSSNVQCASRCRDIRPPTGYMVTKGDNSKCCCVEKKSQRYPSLPSAHERRTICLFANGHDEHGSRCRQNSHCSGVFSVCFKRSCHCLPGLHYNPRTQMCVRRCTEWGNTGSVYPGLSIKGHTNRKEESISAPVHKHCIRKCAKMTDFLCISVDIFYNNCYYSDVGFFDVVKAEREYGQFRWELLVMNCKY